MASIWWASFGFPSYVSTRFFFEYVWSWSSVITGCNDVSLFHACTSFGLPLEFKLHRDSYNVPFRCTEFWLLQLSWSISWEDCLKFDILFSRSALKPWADIPTSFNHSIYSFLLAYCSVRVESILDNFPSICWFLSFFCFSFFWVFITNMVHSNFCPDKHIE